MAPNCDASTIFFIIFFFIFIKVEKANENDLIELQDIHDQALKEIGREQKKSKLSRRVRNKKREEVNTITFLCLTLLYVNCISLLNVFQSMKGPCTSPAVENEESGVFEASQSILASQTKFVEQTDDESCDEVDSDGCKSAPPPATPPRQPDAPNTSVAGATRAPPTYTPPPQTPAPPQANETADLLLNLILWLKKPPEQLLTW